MTKIKDGLIRISNGFIAVATLGAMMLGFLLFCTAIFGELGIPLWLRIAYVALAVIAFIRGAIGIGKTKGDAEDSE